MFGRRACSPTGSPGRPKGIPWGKIGGRVVVLPRWQLYIKIAKIMENHIMSKSEVLCPLRKHTLSECEMLCFLWKNTV